MNTTTKKLLAIGCGVAAAATWVPVLLSGGEAAPRANADLPAEGLAPMPSAGAEAPIAPASAELEPESAASEHAAPSSAPVSASAKEAAPAGELAGGLAQLQSTVDGGKDARQEALLERLARAWSDEKEPAKEAAPTQPAAPTVLEVAPQVATSKKEEQEREDPADVFLRAHPLHGCLVSSSTRTALLGDLVVRENDALAGGALLVLTIDAQSVVVVRGAVETRITLEPFRSMPPRTERAGSTGGPEASGAGSPNPAPEVRVAPPAAPPIPPAPATNDAASASTTPKGA
ncbi:MAG: hypothetical protein HZA53_02265 [Planctomycetes bacterium]|nr:hypothetical protein [Planctomycetota bacterium]